jgi:hypothetical protein
VNGIEVYLTFYLNAAETTRHTVMPAIPAIGDTLHWSLTGDDGDSRAWRVNHISWVPNDQNRSVWHVEVALV